MSNPAYMHFFKFPFLIAGTWLICALAVSSLFAQAPVELAADGFSEKEKKRFNRENRYWGIDRREAKTSAVRDSSGALLPVTDYGDVLNLLARLPSDKDMRGRHKAFYKGPKLDKNWLDPELVGNRYPEERQNVRIRGYIFAAKRMNDNDYHLSFLSAPDTGTAGVRLMNVEVAGIRKESVDAHLLIEARRDLLEVFDGDIAKNTWVYFEKPIYVQVSGALFFDGKHERTKMKPLDFSPVTAWEIHPVYSIERIPDELSENDIRRSD